MLKFFQPQYINGVHDEKHEANGLSFKHNLRKFQVKILIEMPTQYIYTHSIPTRYTKAFVIIIITHTHTHIYTIMNHHHHTHIYIYTMHIYTIKIYFRRLRRSRLDCEERLRRKSIAILEKDW